MRNNRLPKKAAAVAVSVLAVLSLPACARANEENRTPDAEVRNDISVQEDTAASAEQKEEGSEELMENSIKLIVNDTTLTATLEDNSSAEALAAKLKEGDLTLDLSDYGNMEKVGGFGFSLPRNDQQIHTQAGDLILYQGNSFVIYYDTNSWNFTRLGRIDDITAEELKEVLGSGDVTVTLSIN